MPDLIQNFLIVPLEMKIVAALATIAISTLLYRLGFRFSKINLPFFPAVLERKPTDTPASSQGGPDHVGATGGSPPRVEQNIRMVQSGQAIGNIEHADRAQFIGTQNIYNQSPQPPLLRSQIPRPLAGGVGGIEPQGFIPPQNVVKYIDRGDIESQVRASLRDSKLAAIVGVTSPGGAGKTELAIRAANELVGRLGRSIERPYDAVFWITMTGREIESCLADLARQTGVELPPQLDLRGRADAVKSRLGQMRALVVLDDVHASHTAKLDLLIPPPPCATLVTSRIRDIKLIPTTAMYPLDRMTPDQARELLVSILGSECVSAELDSADKLAERVCYNPLALDISARLIKRMSQDGVANPITAFYSRVKDRLKDIKIGEGERESLFACIGLSYDDLSARNQKCFFLLAAFHPTGFSVNVAADFWGIDEGETRSILDDLVNRSLLKHVNADRYRFYDLTDEFASHKLRESGFEDPARGAHAECLLKLFSKHETISTESPPLGLEWDNLKFCAEWAIAKRDGMLLTYLATVPMSWLISVFQEWSTWDSWLLQAIELGISDQDLQGRVLFARGELLRLRFDLEGALKAYVSAYDMFKSSNSLSHQAQTLLAISDVHTITHNIDAALMANSEALQLCRATGSQLGEANVLFAKGRLQEMQRNYDAALDSHLAALNLYKEQRAAIGMAETLLAIGELCSLRSEYDRAWANYNEALDICRTAGIRVNEARVLGSISCLNIQLGNLAAGETALLQALEIHQRSANGAEMARTYANFALALNRHGEKVKARHYAALAEPLFRAIGHPGAEDMKRIMEGSKG